MTCYPNYYPAFRCIAGACRHSCCVGWEIDIDETSAARFAVVPGDFGDRLREQIESGSPPHFRMQPDGRCPFLNRDGLCDMILTLGEDSLCDICREHPRFYNEYGDRLEIGLGLTCEAAGRLILNQREPVTLLCEGEAEEDELVSLRNDALVLCQNGDMEAALALFDAAIPDTDMTRWAALLLSLERLEPEWTARLTALQAGIPPEALAAFDAHMAGREHEFRNLGVYLLYRHVIAAETWEDAAARAAFAMFGCMLIRALGALQYRDTGAFTFGDQVQLCRQFSSEIEYSDENLDLILTELY